VLLAVDVGNTQTALGLYAGEELTEHGCADAGD
jgi:pantothenate kinase type III